MTKIYADIIIDFGQLDREDQLAVLKELIETMPDKDIAFVISENGTQELVELLEPWIAENTPDDEAEVPEITLEDVEAGHDKGEEK